MKQKLLLISLILLIPVLTVFAQNKPSEKKARRILKELSLKYKKYKTIEAHFSFTLNNPQDHINEVQSGVLYVDPAGNKYHLQLNGQELFSDGKLTYTYLKAQKEMQLANVDTNTDAINPAKIFSMYETGYDASYSKEVQQGKLKLDVIDLIPQHSKKIVKAQISVLKRQRQIYQVRLFDKSGNQYTYTVNQFIPNPALSPDIFVFNKKNYPGVEVIDLR